MYRGRFILNTNGEPVAESDVAKWYEWFETADRVVGEGKYNAKDGELIVVRTSFLGIDYDPCPDSPPNLWETMIYGGEYDEWLVRACNRVKAEANHHINLFGMTVTATGHSSGSTTMVTFISGHFV